MNIQAKFGLKSKNLFFVFLLGFEVLFEGENNDHKISYLNIFIFPNLYSFTTFQKIDFFIFLNQKMLAQRMPIIS